MSKKQKLQSANSEVPDQTVREIKAENRRKK